jgi:DNA-binding response OmpR family regulator
MRTVVNVAQPDFHHRVLVVDDDEKSCLLVADALEPDGYVVLSAPDGNTALSLIRESGPDIVVLDLGLPEISGLDVLACVREFSDVPILILSGRTDEGDRVQGLRLGADDYIIKPCSPRELAARVGAVLRRSHPNIRSSTLDFDGMHIDIDAHQIVIDGREVDLTPREFDLLVCLARSPRTAFTRAQLLRTVWVSSTDWQTPATVTEHVRRLRGKIEVAPDEPRWVVTVRGLGYRFDPRPPSASSESAAAE